MTNNFTPKKSRKKIYRKKKKTYNLRGGFLKSIPKIPHPLSNFVSHKAGENYVIEFHSNNIQNLNYEDIYSRAFFNKFVDILNISFEREREHAIEEGYYSSGYQNTLQTIKSNLYNPNFSTYILTSSNLTPISFLYLEKTSDYDKVWTVCTEPEKRGQGMSSKLLGNFIISRLNLNKPKLLLEVFNDTEIKRRGDDVGQKQIMGLFYKNGFEETPYNKMSKYTYSNLMKKNGETKIMIFNPNRWYSEHSDEHRNLNSRARRICNSRP